MSFDNGNNKPKQFIELYAKFLNKIKKKYIKIYKLIVSNNKYIFSKIQQKNVSQYLIETISILLTKQKIHDSAIVKYVIDSIKYVFNKKYKSHGGEGGDKQGDEPFDLYKRIVDNNNKGKKKKFCNYNRYW